MRPVADPFQLGDQRPLFGQQPFRLLMFLGQPLPLGLHQPAILAHQLRALDRPGKRPQQRPRRRLGDAGIGIRADLERLGRQFGRRLRAEHDHRLVVSAGAKPFDELQTVEHVGFVAHEHRVEHFVAQPGEPGRDADRFFERDLRRAVGRERLGEPAARAVERGHVQHLDPGRHLAPDFRRVARWRMGGGERGHNFGAWRGAGTLASGARRVNVAALCGSLAVAVELAIRPPIPPHASNGPCELPTSIVPAASAAT